MGSKSWWKIVNRHLVGKQREISTSLPKLTDGANEITSDQAIVDTFAKHFANIHADSLPLDEATEGMIYDDRVIDAELSELQIRDSEIVALIGQIPNWKSNRDRIPIFALKLISKYISKPLAHIFSLSLQSGDIPDDFKLSRVTALHKGGDKRDVKNYRSIFVPPIFALLLEKLVAQKLMDHFERHCILAANQFGFRRRHSTVHAALRVANAILLEADARKAIGVVFVDIKNAFPSANHIVLLKKLSHYGIKRSLHKWFFSYLTNRHMYVEIAGLRSQTKPITKGVPQGSALGPLLFLIYINDIVNSLSCSTTLFADDMELHVTGDNTLDVTNKLNHELEHLKEFMKTNRLELNVRKTVCMFPFVKNPSTAVKYDGELLSIVSEFKYLGVLFDSDFTWKSHFLHVITKVKQHMYIMHRSRYYCQRAWRKLLFAAFIKPFFLYGIEVWYTAQFQHREQLELLYRRCLRIILDDIGPIPLISRLGVYSQTASWPLMLEFQYRAGVILYSVIRVRSIAAYSNFFSFTSARSDTFTRRIADTTLTNTCRIVHQRTQAALIWWGSMLWNSIPREIRNSSSKASFCSQYRKYLSLKLQSNYELHRRYFDFV
jgi:hypothetical protein